jgi:sulfonate transport system substrate-binding protein
MTARKIVLTVAFIAIAGGFILALATRSGGDANVLRVANQKGQIRSMMIASGVLEGAPYHVEWSEFPAAQPLLEAVSSGAVDLGLAGDAPFIFAYQSGGPIRAIAVQVAARRSPQSLSILVKQDSPIRNVGDLVGKTVATTRGSIGHHLILQAIEGAKIPLKEIKVTFLPPGDAKAAFDSGAIDAWSTWTPYTSVAVKEGARVVVDGKDFDLPFSVDVAYVPSIEPKRAMLQDFLRREAQALAWTRAHPEQFAQVFSKETGLPLEIAHDTFQRSYREARAVDAGIIARERQITDRFRRAGYFAGDRNIEQAFDRSFAPPSLAEASPEK